MAKRQYGPTITPMSVEDVQEAISEALIVIGELQAFVERSQLPVGDPTAARPRRPIDPLMERRIERLKDKLRECNRAVAELPKQAEGVESVIRRLTLLAEAAIKLFEKFFGGGSSP